MPLVTAVIPCHNGAAYVGAAIDSVLAQTHQELEVVVADDGSADESPEIVAAYGPPVRLIRVRHGNMHATRNAAIAASHGDYIGLVDQDDAWWPEKIERQLARFDAKREIGLCYTATRGVDDDGREIPGSRRRLVVAPDQTEALGRLLALNLMTASSVLLPRAVIDRTGPFDTSFRLTGDWDLWLKVAEEYPIVAVPQVLTDYRVHGANTSRNKVAMLEESIRVQESALQRIARHPRWSGDPGLRPYLRTARHKLASRYSELGIRLARQGHGARALVCHRRALELERFSPRIWWRLVRSRLHRGAVGSEAD